MSFINNWGVPTNPQPGMNGALQTTIAPVTNPNGEAGGDPGRITAGLAESGFPPEQNFSIFDVFTVLQEADTQKNDFFGNPFAGLFSNVDNNELNTYIKDLENRRSFRFDPVEENKLKIAKALQSNFGAVAKNDGVISSFDALLTAFNDGNPFTLNTRTDFQFLFLDYIRPVFNQFLPR